MAAGIAGAQNFVNWVDAQGQTHFSDHAPTGPETEAVPVNVSRPRLRGPRALWPLCEQLYRIQLPRMKSRRGKRKKSSGESNAKCNQAHEIYCNQGPDAIRQRAPTQFQPAKIVSLVVSDRASCRSRPRNEGLK